MEADAYTITADGERAVASSPVGSLDDRIDTPSDVAGRIDSFDLRPDRADAVRAAFAFLKFWGDATRGEVVDGVYSEHPAGYESGREWWAKLVRDRLADLPSVDSPSAEGSPWRDTETPDGDDEDGRTAPDDPTPPETSARFALDGLDLDGDERSAVRAAFDHLLAAGTASESTFQREVSSDYPAGYESESEWWTDCVRPAFERLPGVEESNGAEWEYRQSAAGPASTGPGAESSGDSGHGE
ncbi:hypothetical protein BRC81_13155 [Halobacteriales archaeon QS_1_68_20]|nr:MAG: hypothetical protein BRC81_13155 [Halobacteriales archaeon QS_1_68_20]